MKKHIYLYKGEGIGPELFKSLRAFFCLFEDIIQFTDLTQLEEIDFYADGHYILCGPLEDDLLLKAYTSYSCTTIPWYPSANKLKNTEVHILAASLIENSSEDLEMLLDPFFSKKEKVVLIQQYKEQPQAWAPIMKHWASLAFSSTEWHLEDQNVYSFIRQGAHSSISQLVTSPDLEKIITGIYAASSHSLNASYKLIKVGEWLLSMPVHGHAPDITGMGIANPLAILFAFCGLLRQMGYLEKAQIVENQILILMVTFPEQITPDMGGVLNTEKYIAIITECINLQWKQIK